MTYNEFIFTKKLARLMEKHGVKIASRTNGDYTKVVFQSEENDNFLPHAPRTQFTAFDLRSQGLGMGSRKANRLYAKHKAKMAEE